MHPYEWNLIKSRYQGLLGVGILVVSVIFLVLFAADQHRAKKEAANKEVAVKYLEQGRKYRHNGQYPLAVDAFKKALERYDKEAAIHLEYGLALIVEKETEKAQKEFREFIRLQKDKSAALNSLAWELATAPLEQQRDPELAHTLAAQAVGLQENPGADSLATLAAASAATGRFRDAISQQSAALAAAESDDARKQWTERLALYQQGRAFVRKSYESDAGIPGGITGSNAEDRSGDGPKKDFHFLGVAPDGSVIEYWFDAEQEMEGEVRLDVYEKPGAGRCDSMRAETVRALELDGEWVKVRCREWKLKGDGAESEGWVRGAVLQGGGDEHEQPGLLKKIAGEVLDIGLSLLFIIAVPQVLRRMFGKGCAIGALGILTALTVAGLVYSFGRSEIWAAVGFIVCLLVIVGNGIHVISSAGKDRSA